MPTNRNYRLKREIITICLVDYQICSLFDRQQFDEDDLEAATRGITSATWSLFGVVWPASQVLATEVSVAALAGKRVLEIGCGIGLASIVLHKMGEQNPLLGKFDLIIASDVLYQPQHAQNLSHFISAHSSDDVKVIVVDPGRENRAKFTHHMIALGYSHQFTNFNQQLSASVRCKGRILNYQRQYNPLENGIGTDSHAPG